VTVVTTELEAAEGGRQPGRLGREGWIMLVVPPVLIALAVGGFLWWRATTTFTDPVEAQQLRWSELRLLTWEHIKLTFVSAAIVVVLSVPAGVMLTRRVFRPVTPIVIGIANFGQSAPAVGLIILLYLWLRDFGFSGFWVAVVTLSLYGILPVLRNTITGIQGVDPTLVEAGRGVGMTTVGTLVTIELRLAVPVIMSGIRTSLVLIAGTAALACFINAGGLGTILYTGISLFRFSLMIVGALLIALLALLIEWLGRVVEFAVRPKGV